jgi:hypothetical protein
LSQTNRQQWATGGRPVAAVHHYQVAQALAESEEGAASCQERERAVELATRGLVAAGWLPPRPFQPEDERTREGDAVEQSSGTSLALCLHLVEALARVEEASGRLEAHVQSSSRPAGETLAAAHERYQLVQDALLFGAIELAATLGAPDDALPG